MQAKQIGLVGSLILLLFTNCSGFESQTSRSRTFLHNASNGLSEFASTSDTSLEETRIWIAPHPFVTGSIIRSDFSNLWLRPQSWSHVRGRAQVLKNYLNILDPNRPVDLLALVQQVKSAGLKVAFEVGGLRPEQFCGSNAGANQANHELRLLRRWREAGGDIDFLTTDHAIGFVIEARLNGRCHMTIEDAIPEVIAYFRALRQEFPNARLGMIESLGYWYVDSPDGVSYQPSRSELRSMVPSIRQLLTRLRNEFTNAAMNLEHFDIDYGMEGVEFDGRGSVRSRFTVNNHDYGRILGAYAVAQELGIKSGLIVNAFHVTDRQKAPSSLNAQEAQRASREVRDRTAMFFEEFRRVGGLADRYLIQFWQPFPHLTGTESSENVSDSLFVIRQLVDLVTNPAPAGYFKVGSTIFYSNGSRHCMFDSIQRFVASSGSSDTSQIPNYPMVPVSSIDDGICVIDGFDSREVPLAAISEGLFRDDSTVYYSNGQNYCAFQSMNDLTLSVGAVDLASIRRVTSIPELMTNDGACQVPAIRQGLFIFGPTIFYSNGRNYCAFLTWNDFVLATGQTHTAGILRVVGIPSSMANDGACQVPRISAGLFMVGSTVFYSNGTNYCAYGSWGDYIRATGRKDTVGVRSILGIPSSMTNDGICRIN